MQADGQGSEREHALRRDLLEAHEQMLARDTVFQHCEQEIRNRERQIVALAEERGHLNEAVHALQARVDELDDVIRRMRMTRVWRVGESYWHRRAQIARLLGRRKGSEA